MTAGVCLTLNGCSWFAKDPCVGPDADLSNPVCVTQTQGGYRDTDNERWYCLGDLEAKDWSCATSPQEASRQLNTADHWLAEISEHPGVSGGSVATLSKAPSSDKETETAQADNALASHEAIASNDPPATNDHGEIDTNAASPALLQPARLESTVIADGQSAIPAASEPALDIPSLSALLTSTPSSAQASQSDPHKPLSNVTNARSGKEALAAPGGRTRILAAATSGAINTSVTDATQATTEVQNKDSDERVDLPSTQPQASLRAPSSPSFLAGSGASPTQLAALPTDIVEIPKIDSTHSFEPIAPERTPIELSDVTEPVAGDPPLASLTDTRAAEKQPRVEPDSSVEPVRASLESEVILATPSDYPTGTTLAEIYTADAKRRSNSSPALETLAPDAAISQARQLAEVANSGGASQKSISKPTSLMPPPASSTTHYLKPEPSIAVTSPIDFDNLKSPSSSGDPNFDYFMDLPPNDFAVQLKADRTLSGIQTFAREVSLDSPLVLKTIPSKSPLYILVLETFNDIQLASDAKSQWISQFDNGIEPWIRTVGSIQKTLQPIGPLD